MFLVLALVAGSTLVLIILASAVGFWRSWHRFIDGLRRLPSKTESGGPTLTTAFENSNSDADEASILDWIRNGNDAVRIELHENAFRGRTIEPTMTVLGRLGRLGTILLRHQEILIQVVGYTATNGKRDGDRAFVAERAAHIADLLVSHGVARERVSSAGCVRVLPTQADRIRTEKVDLFLSREISRADRGV